MAKVISNPRIPKSYLLKPNSTVFSNILYFPIHGKNQINILGFTIKDNNKFY